MFGVILTVLTAGVGGVAAAGAAGARLASTAKKLTSMVKDLAGLLKRKRMKKDHAGDTNTRLESKNEIKGLLHSERSKKVRAYVDDIEKRTGKKLHQKQKELLKNDLKENEYIRLSPEQVKSHRKDFNKKKNKLINEWEKETGQTWPTSLTNKGKTQKYDAHHIIENKVGGKNEWWNIHPAQNGNVHQGGIHRTDSPATELFGR